MKLEINFDKLRNAIQSVERIAGKHMTLQVLSCILIDVKKNSAIFKTTNLDLGVEVTVPVKASEDGVMAVPANIISSFVSQVYDQNHIVKMESEAGTMTINAGKSRGTIKLMTPDDFPTIPHVSDGEPLTLSAQSFVKGLKSVWYSSSISSVKPELASVYVYKDGDYMVFAATDSFRLAEKKMKMTAASNKLGDVLIPFKNVSDIVRLLENMGENVTVRMNKNLISFENEGTYIISRIIDGVFPDYRQIIPKGFSTEAVVLKQDFLNALKVSNIFSDKFNQMHLTIDPKEKVFSIQTKNSDVGENTSSVDAALTGEKVEINFNYKYVADCFQSIDADSVSLQLGGLNRPMVVKPVSGDQTFMYLVMPMNR